MRGVVLLTMARSRSSMTAEIFRRHGVFFGRTRRMADGGIGYNENLALKRVGRRLRGDCHDAILAGEDASFAPSDFANTWSGILEAEGFKGGVWGAKVDVFCDRLFGGMAHVKIGIKRNEADTVASCVRILKARPEEDWRRIVRAHHERLEGLGIPMIDTDEVVAGDHSSLASAFEECGLVYDRSLAEFVIVR